MRIIVACIILLIYSCKKGNDGSGTPQTWSPVLNSNVSSITLGAFADSKDSFNISSNISWTISLIPASTTWASLSTSSGANNTKIYITTTQNNTLGLQKIATIILTPVGTTSIPTISISVIQNPMPANPFILWQKTLGGSGNDQLKAVIRTQDDGYLVAGNTDSGGGSDAWIVKLNNDGGIVWQKTFGGTSTDVAYSIIATPDGGYAFAGKTSSTDGDVVGLHGVQGDMWVVKLDGSGNKIWQKTLGGTGDDIAYSVVATLDGGFFVVGRTLSNNGDVTGYHDGGDVLVIKLNNNGDIVWTKVIGGRSQDVGFSIITTPDNGCIITGNTSSNDGDISGLHGDGDALAVRLDANGSIVWQKAFGGSQNDQAVSIIATNDGGYILAGYTTSNDGDVSGNHGNGDGWILKINAAGILQWQKAFGGTNQDNFNINSLNINSQNQFIISGSSYSNDGDVLTNNGYTDFWIILMDAIGNILSKKSFGGTGADESYGIVSTKDGNYITVGNSASNNGDVSGNHGGANDAWIVKFKFQ